MLSILSALSPKILPTLLLILEKVVDLRVVWGIFRVYWIWLAIFNDYKEFYKVLDLNFNKLQAMPTKK